MTVRRLSRAAAAAAACLAGVSCQNPFDPKADLRMIRFDANAGTYATFARNSAWSGGSDASMFVTMVIGNWSSVQVSLTSYTVVYRQIGAQVPPSPCPQPPGNPICILGGAAGRTFPMTNHVGGLTDDKSGNGFVQADVRIRPVSFELLNYIVGGAGAATVNGGIDMDIVLFGEDHNGHDVKVAGTLHLEVQ